MVTEIAALLCFALVLGLVASIVGTLRTPVPAESARLSLLPGRIRPAKRWSTEAIDHWMILAVRRAGIEVAPEVFLNGVTCLSFAIAATLWMLEFGEALAGTAAVASLLVCLVALKVLLFLRERKFRNQFPAAVELLARCVRAGESLEDGLRLTAAVSPEPVKRELNQTARQLGIGLSVSHAMAELQNRMPTDDVRIFSHTISIHRETGGRLSDALDRIVRVIRQRKSYLDRINTATAMGRYSALVVCLMGVLVPAAVLLIHPDYIRKLISTELGRTLLIYAVMSQLVGVIWLAFLMRKED